MTNAVDNLAVAAGTAAAAAAALREMVPVRMCDVRDWCLSFFVSLVCRIAEEKAERKFLKTNKQLQAKLTKAVWTSTNSGRIIMLSGY